MSVVVVVVVGRGIPSIALFFLFPFSLSPSLSLTSGLIPDSSSAETASSSARERPAPSRDEASSAASRRSMGEGEEGSNVFLFSFLFDCCSCLCMPGRCFSRWRSHVRSVSAEGTGSGIQRGQEKAAAVEGRTREKRVMHGRTRFFFFFLHFFSLQKQKPHSAAVISGVLHPASTTTLTIREAPPLPPLVGVEESDGAEEGFEAERRFAFLAGLPASKEEVELIPNEGGTERLLAAEEPFLLLRQATREEAAVAERRKKTTEAGRPAV